MAWQLDQPSVQVHLLGLRVDENDDIDTGILLLVKGIQMDHKACWAILW